MVSFLEPTLCTCMGLPQTSSTATPHGQWARWRFTRKPSLRDEMPWCPTAGAHAPVLSHDVGLLLSATGPREPLGHRARVRTLGGALDAVGAPRSSEGHPGDWVTPCAGRRCDAVHCPCTAASAPPPPPRGYSDVP